MSEERLIKKGSVVIPRWPYDEDGETSYTGKFKESGKNYEFILQSKDKIIEGEE